MHDRRTIRSLPLPTPLPIRVPCPVCGETVHKNDLPNHARFECSKERRRVQQPPFFGERRQSVHAWDDRDHA